MSARGSRTVLREAGGEIPPAYSPAIDAAPTGGNVGFGRLRSSGIHRLGRPPYRTSSCSSPLWLGSAFSRGFRRGPVDPGGGGFGEGDGRLVDEPRWVLGERAIMRYARTKVRGIVGRWEKLGKARAVGRNKGTRRVLIEAIIDKHHIA